MVAPTSTMARAARGDRTSIADSTLTLRLTREDRALLHELVARRARDATDEGIQVTSASYVRGLIRREARALGLLQRASMDGDPRRSADFSVASERDGSRG